jgi:glyoxylase-like metal-dependent hydrolase (beta-lactamase superfamily II)
MIKKISPNVFQFYFQEFGSCVYLIQLNNKNILIDTSSKINQTELIQNLNELEIKIKDVDIIILTHLHWDHKENIDLFKNSKIYSKDNIKNLNIPEFKIIKTPGHTPDSICILYKDILFSGDTIFHNDGRGRTDLKGGSEFEIIESIKKLSKINYKILCPGHI